MKLSELRRHLRRSQFSILAAFGALAFVVSAVAAGLSGYLSAAIDVGVQSTIEDASATDTAFEVSAVGGSVVGFADEAVDEHLAAMLDRTPYEVHRSRVSGPRWVYADGSDGSAENRLTRGLFIAYDDLEANADLVAGSWHSEVEGGDGDPIAVHATSAEALGVSVGDVISISQNRELTPLEVVGLYLPRDPDSAFWNSATREIEGRSESVGAVMAIDAAVLEREGSQDANLRWRVEPDVSGLRSADVESLRSAIVLLQQRLESDSRMGEAVMSVDTELADVLMQSSITLHASRSVALVPLVIFGAISTLALVVVARLLGVVRERDTSLLRARGASTSTMTGVSAHEAVLAGVVPALLGGVLAWLVVPRLPDVGASVSALVIALGTAAAAALAFGTLTLAGARAAALAVSSTATRRAESTRRRTVTRSGTVVLVFTATGLSVWQLVRYDSPIVVDADGIARTDPLAVSAPAALLVTGGLLAAAGVAAAAWIASAIARRRRGLSLALTARQVARRPAANALPVVLLVLVAGISTLAAGFAATWSDLQQDAAQARVGADIQVVLGPENSAGVTTRAHGVGVDEYRAIDGVVAAEPVTIVPRAGLSDGRVYLSAGSGETPFPGVVLPPGSTHLDMELQASASAELSAIAGDGDFGDAPPVPVAVRLWLADGDGVVSLVQTQPISIPTGAGSVSLEISADVPNPAGQWTLAGFEFSFGAPGEDALWTYDYDVAVAAVRVGDEMAIAPMGDEWTTLALRVPEFVPDQFSVEQHSAGPGIGVSSGGLPWWGVVTARVVPTPDFPDMPVTATTGALDRFGLDVGDSATMRVLGVDIPFAIVASTPAIAGTTVDEALSGDGTMLAAQLLAAGSVVPLPDQIRLDVRGASNEQLSQEVAAAAGPTAELIDRVTFEDELRGNVFAGLGVVTFWVTAGASVLLAAGGLAAATAVLAKQRRVEVGVLRTLGLGSADQARGRRRELTLVALLGVGLGALAGLAAAKVAAGLLAVAATPIALENLDPALGVAVGPLAVLLGALVLVALFVAGAASSGVRRDASDPALREVGS